MGEDGSRDLFRTKDVVTARNDHGHLERVPRSQGIRGGGGGGGGWIVSWTNFHGVARGSACTRRSFSVTTP